MDAWTFGTPSHPSRRRRGPGVPRGRRRAGHRGSPEQLEHVYRLADPALAELSLEPLLGELLTRAQRPGDLGEIIRLADDARKANKSLFRCRNALGPFFSLLDPLDLPLNVE